MLRQLITSVIEVVKPSLYRHFKDKWYVVLCVAEHTETGEPMVVYQAQYDDYKIYTRPYSMFLEKVPKAKENPTLQKFRFMTVDEINNEILNDLDMAIENKVKIHPSLCHAHEAIKEPLIDDCCIATCKHCGTSLGWWCPESPDGLCDYEQEDGSYDEDNCRYCGNPEERK